MIGTFCGRAWTVYRTAVYAISYLFHVLARLGTDLLEEGSLYLLPVRLALLFRDLAHVLQVQLRADQEEGRLLMHVILDFAYPDCQFVEAFEFLDGVEEDDCGDSLVMRLDD